MNPLSVLRDSLYFFRRHLPNIIQLCLPLVVLEALLTQLLYRQLGDQASPAYGMLISLLCYPLYSAALILYLDTVARARTSPSATCSPAPCSCGRNWPC